MRSFGLACAVVAVLALTGCGQSGPKRAPLAPPKKPLSKLPADEAGAATVEEVAVEVEESATSEAPAADATAATETGSAETGDKPSTPAEPAAPAPPRPSVFLKLLAQPAQDAMKNNVESLTSGAGGLLPTP
jgi:hypothetical protein